MQSSRIFVKGLPPSAKEQDVRTHFSQNKFTVTDVKLIPHRRIGYIGYRSPEEAESAVKYFNKTYLRLSRLLVEIAKPIGDPALARTATFTKSADTDVGTNKRKREEPEAETKDSKKVAVDVGANAKDAKFQEYYNVMKSSGAEVLDTAPVVAVPALPADEESDDEYQQIPSKRSAEEASSEPSGEPSEPSDVEQTVVIEQPTRVREPLPDAVPDTQKPVQTQDAPAVRQTPAFSGDDDDWLRSRTNRALDFVEEEELSTIAQKLPVSSTTTSAPTSTSPSSTEQLATPPPSDPLPSAQDAITLPSTSEDPEETIAKTKRVFVRNLPYSATEEDVENHFQPFGPIEEVHLPTDKSGKSKGFAMVLFAEANAALEAFRTADGTPFQGRLLHVLPAFGKKDPALDEFALSKLPLKQQNIIRKRAEAATSSFNWNSLYMKQDAVNTAIAERLGVSKADLFDPTSTDAGVKQAIAETTIIQETKSYFLANGVDLDAFKSKKRGDVAILVKNFPHGTTMDELRRLFAEHGSVLRVLMPPSGTIAIVQFQNPSDCKKAFAKLAYRRIKESILFLEKAPANLLVSSTAPAAAAETAPAAAVQAVDTGVQKLSVADLLEKGEPAAEADVETTSLFVRNLNFETTTDQLADAFRSLDGFASARVKMKPAGAKKPGQLLSMGFGFVEFRTKEQALAALQVMDGHTLHGHVLSVKQSHRGLDAAEERRREDRAKKLANRSTKVIIKNLPFEVTKKDVRSLFSNYGQLRSVRVPKKFNNTSRGFAFAEFITAREAENALTALRDTHFLGRRLVLDYAEAETLDAEEEIARMQRKVGGQQRKVNLQELTNKSRRTKVTFGEQDED